MKNKIIDSDFHTDWGKYVFAEKEIKWQGKANIEYSFRFLENGIYHDVMTGISSILLIYFLLLGSICKILYDSGYTKISIAVGLLSILCPFLFELWRSNNHKKTEYAITEKYLIFKLYNGVRFRFETIPLNSIVKTHLNLFENNKGTIHIITNSDPNFKTYNGKNSKKQDHPTLELIENSKEVNELINGLIKGNKIRIKNYTQPKISKKTLQITKYFYAIALIISSLYAFDYSLLIQSIEEDKIIALAGGASNDGSRNGRYTTQQGYHFSTNSYSRSIVTEEISIKRSIIFNTVKEVRLRKNNISLSISSGLNNNIFKGVYFLVLLCLLIGYCLIYNKDQITKELYEKIIISLFVYSGILIFIWRLLN